MQRASSQYLVFPNPLFCFTMILSTLYQFICDFSNTATSLTIKEFNFHASSDFIRIKWAVRYPILSAKQYKFHFSCTLLCNEKLHYVLRRAFTSIARSVKLGPLHPASKCSMTFTAVYNPASLDPGVRYNFTTLYESK